MLQRLTPGSRYMLLSALSFSAMGACVKMLGAHFPTSELVAARALVTLALSAIAVQRAGLNPWGNDRPRLLLRGVLGFCGLSCVYYSLTHLPIAEATVLQYLHPVFTAVLSPLLLREVPTRRNLLCVGLGLVGALLVSRPSLLFDNSDLAAPLDPTAVLVAIGGALFSSLAYITVRKLSATDHPQVIVLYFPMIAVPASLPGLLAEGRLPVGSEWLWLLLVGLLTQAGQVTLTHGMRTQTALRATTFSYTQILFAILWGVLLADGWPTPLTLLGALVVLGATLLQLSPAQPSKT